MSKWFPSLSIITTFKTEAYQAEIMEKEKFLNSCLRVILKYLIVRLWPE